MVEMVKAVNENSACKVLTREEYDLLIAAKDEKGSGHIDEVAKDAMLRSKFWTGLKSQSLKNSTQHLYDTIKDTLIPVNLPRLVHQLLVPVHQM